MTKTIIPFKGRTPEGKAIITALNSGNYEIVYTEDCNIYIINEQICAYEGVNSIYFYVKNNEVTQVSYSTVSATSDIFEPHKLARL